MAFYVPYDPDTADPGSNPPFEMYAPSPPGPNDTMGLNIFAVPGATILKFSLRRYTYNALTKSSILIDDETIHNHVHHIFRSLFTAIPSIQVNHLNDHAMFDATMVSFPPPILADKFFRITKSDDGQTTTIATSISSTPPGTDVSHAIKAAIAPDSNFTNQMKMINARCFIHPFETFDVIRIGYILFRSPITTNRTNMEDELQHHLVTHLPTGYSTIAPKIEITIKPHKSPTSARAEILTVSCDQKHSHNILAIFLQYPIQFPTGIFLAKSTERNDPANYATTIKQHFDFIESTSSFRVTGLHPDVLFSPVPNDPDKATLHEIFLRSPKLPLPPVILFIDEGRRQPGLWFITMYTANMAKALHYTSHLITKVAPFTPHYIFHHEHSPGFTGEIQVHTTTSLSFKQPTPPITHQPPATQTHTLSQTHALPFSTPAPQHAPTPHTLPDHIPPPLLIATHHSPPAPHTLPATNSTKYPRQPSIILPHVTHGGHGYQTPEFAAPLPHTATPIHLPRSIPIHPPRTTITHPPNPQVNHTDTSGLTHHAPTTQQPTFPTIHDTHPPPQPGPPTNYPDATPYLTEATHKSPTANHTKYTRTVTTLPNPQHTQTDTTTISTQPDPIDETYPSAISQPPPPPTPISTITTTTDGTIQATPSDSSSALMLQYTIQATESATENARLRLLLTNLNSQIIALRNSSQSQDENYQQLETSHATLTARHKAKLAAAMASVETHQCQFANEVQQHAVTANELRLANLKIQALEKAVSDLTSPPDQTDHISATTATASKPTSNKKKNPSTKRTATTTPFFSQRPTARQRTINPSRQPWTPAPPAQPTSTTPTTEIDDDTTADDLNANTTTDPPSTQDTETLPTEDTANTEPSQHDALEHDDDETSNHSEDTATLVASIKQGAEPASDTPAAPPAPRPRTKNR